MTIYQNIRPVINFISQNSPSFPIFTQKRHKIQNKQVRLSIFEYSNILIIRTQSININRTGKMQRTPINTQNSTHSVHQFINQTTQAVGQHVQENVQQHEHQHDGDGDGEQQMNITKDLYSLGLAYQKNCIKNGGQSDSSGIQRMKEEVNGYLKNRNSRYRHNSKQKVNRSNPMHTIKIKVEPCPKQPAQSPNPQPLKQCRICLQGQQQGRMVQPCICSGSITYAHQKCLIQWIRRKHDPKLPTSTKTRLQCQMCNTPFLYKWSKNRKLDFTQFCKNYQKQRCNFIMFYIFVFVILMVIVGLIVVITQGSRDSQLGMKIRSIMLKSENIKIIYICVVFILVIVLMFLFILFVIEYGVRSQLVIGEVLNYTQGNGRKHKKIHPKTNNNNTPLTHHEQLAVHNYINQNHSHSSNRQPALQINSQVPASSYRPEITDNGGQRESQQQ